MFSQLGPLFRTHLRQAEKSDARLEIRREEHNDQKKQQDSEEESETGSGLWEDSTAVSIEALKTFLSELLKSRGDTAPDSAEIPAAAEESIPPVTPVNTRTAMAVKAYGQTAAQTPEPAENAAAPAPESETDLVDLLASDDIRTIHALIAELSLLSAKGVHTLQIEKADSFLEALVLAVRLEKAKS